MKCMRYAPWGPRRVRVTQCWAVLTAEDAGDASYWLGHQAI